MSRAWANRHISSPLPLLAYTKAVKTLHSTTFFEAGAQAHQDWDADCFGLFRAPQQCYLWGSTKTYCLWNLSGSCLGCFRRKQIIFSNLLPDAKLSAISTHSGHWSPLIGCLKARCWRQRISTHTSTASLAARAAFSGGKDEATQEEVSDFVTLKNIFFLKFSGNSWFQWPNLLDHPWWWHCNLALSTANIIKMPRVSVLSLFHARSAYTLNLYIHSGKSQGSKKTCSTVYKSF